MKKYKKIGYIFLIITISVLSVVVYATLNKDTEKTEKDKKTSEIEFLDDKLTTIFNQLNNIETRNYNVSVDSITKESNNKNQGNDKSGKQESDQGNSTSNNSTSENKSSDNSTSENNNSNSSDSSSSSSSSDSSEQEKEFNLKNNGVLTNSDEINWDNIKTQIEILYSSIPTITLDLYQTNINQEDILNFNKEFDNLTVSIKQESKEGSLSTLSKLYDYITKFSQNIFDDELKKTLIETKNNILKAYSKLDLKNWQEISNDIKQASNSFSKLLTNTNIDSSKQYTISKIYVMINELQNSAQVQDETIFLIKYKNILEEMNSIK